MKDNWKTKKDSEKSWTVNRERIEENDFILSASAYKPLSSIDQNHREPKEILKEINKLEVELNIQKEALIKSLK